MRLRRIMLPALIVGITTPLIPGFVFSEASAAADPLKQYRDQKLKWQHCDDDAPAKLQCAQIKVPLDYARPDGQAIELAISRVKSPKPEQRRGAMLVNPGGPGESGLRTPLTLDEVPESVTEKYDLIGFDPRGVGKSAPVTCGLNEEERLWLRPYKPETFAKNVDLAHTVADKCRKKTGAKLPYVTTRNTARDMDVIRSVLGEKRISYLGISYGTYLGSVYTQMFPDRTDRVVLDSGVDPARIWRGMIQAWSIESEHAFIRWTKWAAARDSTYHLGDTPDEVRKTFYSLIAAADREPIEFEGKKMTGDDVRKIFDGYELGKPSKRIAALKRIVDGRTPKPSADAAEPGGTASGDGFPVTGPTAADEGSDDNSTAAQLAIMCNDTRDWPRDPEQYRREAIQAKATYPLDGDVTSNIHPCAFWDRAPEPATKVDNDVPVLTLQNERDSQTPLFTGLGMHRALHGSRMVLVEGGEGHGVYLKDPRTCAGRAVNTYLTTGRLPSKDVTCKPGAHTSASASAKNRATS